MMMVGSQVFKDFHFEMEPRVETTQISTNGKMDKRDMIYPSNECYSPIKKNGILIHATIKRALKTLCQMKEADDTQKVTCMNLCI